MRTVLLAWSSTTIARAFMQGHSGQGNQFDDFYVLNSATPGPISALGSTYLIRTLVPSANAVSTWTVVGTGITSLWSAVASIGFQGVDAETTYFHTSSVSATAEFDLQSYTEISGWAASSSEVPVVVQPVAWAFAPSGAANIRVRIINNSGASAVGNVSAVSTATYSPYIHPFNVDPDGASWTLAAFDTLQIGLEFVS